MPKGFTIAAMPLFAERNKYLPLSIDLKMLCAKCCLGPIDSPNHPSSEMFIIKSKLGFLKILPE